MPPRVAACAPCRAVVRRAFREGEDDAERRRKEVIIPSAIILAALNACAFAHAWRGGHAWPVPDAYGVGAMLTGVSAAALAAGALVTRRLPLPSQ
eukprot:gene7784-595_t